MTAEHIEISELDTLLEQERGCLLEGDLEALGALLPAKEQMVEVLFHNGDLNPDTLAPIKSKLERNQLLLDGAMDGIKAVAARLAALRKVRTALDTYDALGRKQSVVTPTMPQMEKRA